VDEISGEENLAATSVGIRRGGDSDVVADVEEIRTRRYFGGSRGVRQCNHTEQCEDRTDGRHQSAARALTGALSTNVHFR
jgi:hypothetical protein